jgi:hypothetical protein
MALRVSPRAAFTRWKDHDAYKESFERVVRDLTSSRRSRRLHNRSGHAAAALGKG